MTFRAFAGRFLLHVVWALTAFVVLLFMMEFVIPGSVTPYLDPIPYAIITLIALCIDATRRPAKPHGWTRLMIGVVIVILFALIVGSDMPGWGKRSVIVICTMIAMACLTAWFVSKRGSDQEER